MLRLQQFGSLFGLVCVKKVMVCPTDDVVRGRNDGLRPELDCLLDDALEQRRESDIQKVIFKVALHLKFEGWSDPARGLVDSPDLPAEALPSPLPVRMHRT